MADCFSSSWPEEVNRDSSEAHPHGSLPGNASSAFDFAGPAPSWLMPGEAAAEERAVSASKSHSQAEKRRRDRINAHLATLRKLIPKSEKMDKAALLGSVIDRVKDLKREATAASNNTATIPTDVDEVTVSSYECDDQDLLGMAISSDKTSKDDIFIKASVCCDDRPELFGELVSALNGLSLRLVRADIASLGGRIKSILILSFKQSTEESKCTSVLMESLNLVLGRIATSSTASTCRFTSKRQRFFFTSSH